MANPITGTVARRQTLRAAHRQTVLMAPSRQYQQWLDRMQVPTARGKVALGLGVRPDIKSMDGDRSYSSPTPSEYDITLSTYFNPQGTREDFGHEMGLGYWYKNLNAQQRQRITALLGVTPKVDPHGNANNLPQEQFAEAYRLLSRNLGALRSRKAYHRFATNASYGYMSHLPHYYQMRKIARVIDSAA